MTAKELRPNEYNPYYQTYINKVGDLELLEGLDSNLEIVLTFFRTIPDDKLEFRYAEGKWNIKEILQHIMDTERIFAYRALRIARQDKTPLPGFDQDDYVLPSKASARNFQSLLHEFVSVRIATLELFKSFDDEMLLATGTASNSSLSARAAGFIIIGHENHHIEVIKERYL